MPRRLTDDQIASSLAAYDAMNAAHDVGTERQIVTSASQLPDPGAQHYWCQTAIYNMSPMKFEYTKVARTQVLDNRNDALPNPPAGFKWQFNALLETMPPKYQFGLVRKPVESPGDTFERA